jgi:hypothetical protein
MSIEPESKPVINLLTENNLQIPPYQRPYKWTRENTLSLLDDIDEAIRESSKHADNEYRYRIGTIILHDNKKEELDIVDGQQRLITLALIYHLIRSEENIKISLLEHKIESNESKKNIWANFNAIKEFFHERKGDQKKFENAFENILEVVVITVEKVSEAFQLFDSQNTRGRMLDPHDLLKAYHLRAMKDHPNEMKHAVERWEGDKEKMGKINTLFKDYLFPIYAWINGEKGHTFSAKDIDLYKGVNFDSAATYARRTVKAMPCYQIDQPFVAGGDFFGFVQHYLNVVDDLKCEVKKINVGDKKLILGENRGAGFSYAEQLFYCAVLYYYDRFRDFDLVVLKRLYAWAFLIRLRMSRLGFDTIKNYAIGKGGYSDDSKDGLAMFYRISRCREAKDVAKIRIPPISKREYKDKKDLENLINSILGEN